MARCHNDKRLKSTLPAAYMPSNPSTARYYWAAQAPSTRAGDGGSRRSGWIVTLRAQS